jgi:parallel beta helix pectate lyase-like protein
MTILVINDLFGSYGGSDDGTIACDAAFAEALDRTSTKVLEIPSGIYLLEKGMLGPRHNGGLRTGVEIVGESQFASELKFTFSESGGYGDGIVAHDATDMPIGSRAQASKFIRISNLTLTNTSHTNRIDPTAYSIQSSGSSPAILIDDHPYNVWSIKIRIATGGPPGTATYDASFDNGASYTVRARFTSTLPFLVPGIGIRAYFPTGTYVAGDTYSIGSTGYSGAAIRTSGGGDITIKDCLFYGWSRGFIDDGGLKNSVENCHFGNKGDPGNAGGGVPLAAQGAVWCTDSTYYFGIQDCTNGFTMKHCRVHTLGFGVWHEGGNNHRVVDCEFSQGCNYSGLIRNVRNVHWSNSYFEGSGGPHGDNPGRGAFISSCQGSNATNLSFDASIVSNLNKIPLIECLFPSGLGMLSGRCNVLIQSPDGSGSPPVGTSLVVGASLIGDLDWVVNWISLSAGTEFDQEPQACFYRSRGLIGSNTINPQAGIHHRHVHATKPIFRFERDTTARGLFQLENDGKLLTHGHTPYGLGPDGATEFVERLTTHTGQLTDTSVFLLPAGRCAAGTVDLLVRSATGNLSAWWQFRVHAKRVDSAAAVMVSHTLVHSSIEGSYLEPLIEMQNDGIRATARQGTETNTGRWEVVWRMTQRSDGG